MERSAIIHSLREYIFKEIKLSSKLYNFMHSIQVSRITVSKANSTEPLAFLLVRQCQTVIHNYRAPKSFPNQGYVQGTCYVCHTLDTKRYSFLSILQNK